MAIDVMKRYENKYLINTDTYFKLQSGISEFMKPDKYNKDSKFYTITNLYYDTQDNNLIRTSLSKPKYKEKLRIRAYGVPTEYDRVFLEIKKKFKGVVNKRRTLLELEEAYSFTEFKIVPSYKDYMNKQVLNELEYLIKLYDLSPRLYLAYDRLAYFGENGLRVTFDTNIRTRRHDLRLEKGDYGDLLLDNDLWLMEVKTEGAIPIWLTKILSENKVYKQSFSKYGTEYIKFIRKEGEGKCLNQSLTLQEKWQPYHGKGLQPQWE